MLERRVFYENSRSKIRHFKTKIGTEIVSSFKRHEICYCHDETGIFVEKYYTADEFFEQNTPAVNLIEEMAMAGIKKEPSLPVKVEPEDSDEFNLPEKIEPEDYISTNGKLYYCTCMPEARKPELAYNFSKYGVAGERKVIASRARMERVAGPDLLGGVKTKKQFTTAYPHLPPSEW